MRSSRQNESRLEQRLIADGEHQGRRVAKKHGLRKIETKDGSRVVFLPRLWPVVFKESHDSIWAGHLRATHTHARISQTYWWSGLAREAKQWIRGCQECGSRKARPREVVHHYGESHPKHFFLTITKNRMRSATDAERVTKRKSSTPHQK